MLNLGLSNTSCCHWLQYISCKEDDQAALVQTIFLVLNGLLRFMLDKIDFPLQCISHSSTFLGKRWGSRLIILFQKRTIQMFLLTLLCVQPMSPLIAAMGVNYMNMANCATPVIHVCCLFKYITYVEIQVYYMCSRYVLIYM